MMDTMVGTTYSMMDTTYWERIREIREYAQLSQQQVASVLHVGQRTYSDYETGKTRIPLDCLIVLARFYNVDLNYVSGVSSIPHRYPRA